MKKRTTGLRWIVIGTAIFIIVFVVAILWLNAMRSTVKVPVAKEDIAARTEIQEGDLEMKDMPKGTVTKDMLGNMDEIVGEYSATKIFKGMPVWRKQLSGEAGDYMADVNPGMRALAIEVSLPQGVGGTLQPDDRVDVVVCDENMAITILQNTRVLDVGMVASGETTEGEEEVAVQVESGIVILEVSPVDGEKIVYATVNATVYLAKDPYSFEPVGTTGADPANVFGPASPIQ